MQIQEAVETCVTQKYADFSSPATRSEFWWFVLFICIINAMLSFAAEWAAGVFGLAMLVPFVAAGTRRLRDTNRSPWWWLLLPTLIPLVVFWTRLGKTPPTPT